MISNADPTPDLAELARELLTQMEQARLFTLYDRGLIFGSWTDEALVGPTEQDQLADAILSLISAVGWEPPHTSPPL